MQEKLWISFFVVVIIVALSMIGYMIGDLIAREAYVMVGAFAGVLSSVLVFLTYVFLKQ